MRNTIFPVYVVMDLSESMSWAVSATDTKKRIEVAKEIIPTLLKSMKNDASTAETVRVRVLGFNQGVKLTTDFLDYYDLNDWYEKEKNNLVSNCQYQTWYGSAFKKLGEFINEDIASIEKQGQSYYRPLVYFLTDGIPEGEDDAARENEYSKLVHNRDSHRNPVILCVGIGEAGMSVLKKYGASRYKMPNNEYRSGNTHMTFVIRKGVKTGEGLEKLNMSVIQTIRNSLSQRLTSGSSTKLEPALPDGVEDELARWFQKASGGV